MRTSISTLLLILMGCTATPQTDLLPAHVHIKDMVGIRHIDNRLISLSENGLESERIFGDSNEKNHFFSGLPSTYQRPNGTLYFIDSQACNIKKFKANGTWIGVLGQRGQGPGEFVLGPIDLAFLPDGRMLISDGNNRRYQWFGKNDQFLKIYISKDHRPWKFATTSLGHIITEDGPIKMPDSISDSTKMFFHYDADFNKICGFGQFPQYSGPNSVLFMNQNKKAVSSKDVFIVAYTMQNKVEYFRADMLFQTMERELAFDFNPSAVTQIKLDNGKTALSIDGDHVTVDMALDRQDNLYLLTYTRPIQTIRKERQPGDIILEIFDNRACLTHRIPIPGIRPGGLFVGQDNAIYISDWDTFQVHRFKPVIPITPSTAQPS